MAHRDHRTWQTLYQNNSGSPSSIIYLLNCSSFQTLSPAHILASDPKPVINFRYFTSGQLAFEWFGGIMDHPLYVFNPSANKWSIVLITCVNGYMMNM